MTEKYFLILFHIRRTVDVYLILIPGSLNLDHRLFQFYVSEKLVIEWTAVSLAAPVGSIINQKRGKNFKNSIKYQSTFANDQQRTESTKKMERFFINDSILPPNFFSINFKDCRFLNSFAKSINKKHYFSEGFCMIDLKNLNSKKRLPTIVKNSKFLKIFSTWEGTLPKWGNGVVKMPQIVRNFASRLHIKKSRLQPSCGPWV